MHPRLKEIQARLAEIRAALTKPDADLDALETEVTALETERGAIEAAITRRAALEARVLDAPAPIGSQPSRPTPSPVPLADGPVTFDAASPEYKAAFLKHLVHSARGRWELGEMTDLEKRAFTYLTTNTTAVLPTGIQLGIVDMIREKYALLGDLNMTGFAGAVEFQQATAIAAGDAAATDENTAASNNLQITFVKVEMTGVEYRASVKIGNKMRIQSIEQFEGFLIETLSDRMGAVMNVAVFTMIDSDVQDANVLTTSTTLDAQEMRQLLGMLKGGVGQRKLYANSFTIWNEIAAVVNSDGDEKFIESSVTDDPTVQGRIYGTPVVMDETLADSVFYIGYPATIKANMFEAPNVESDRDVETRETVFGGYALFEARLGDTRSWVKCTVAQVS